ncbi:NPCBM/NEW2 domain-containing protein [Nocardia sp. NPDC004654]|uniref:NPCBM/NEW2 domain-containing protein n=1 Tax=Nocardia sp. NPDC004654 TaxID=3154776 RepID=UPI0033BBAED3
MDFTKEKRSRWLAATTVLALAVVALSNADGALSFLERLASDASASPSATPADKEALLPETSPATTTSVAPSTSATASAPKTSVPSSAGMPSAGATNSDGPTPSDGWYELTAYQSVAWNNGFDPVDPVRIGSASFPSSIVGYYPSSSSDPMNRATWMVGGKCDRFSVWIGKDAESASSAGVGRFVVKADDREVFADEMSMTDAAREVDIDLSGVVRLTLFDTRKSQDAKNAWGRPRVHCTAPPGRRR